MMKHFSLVLLLMTVSLMTGSLAFGDMDCEKVYGKWRSFNAYQQNRYQDLFLEKGSFQWRISDGVRIGLFHLPVKQDPAHQKDVEFRECHLYAGYRCPPTNPNCDPKRIPAFYNSDRDVLFWSGIWFQRP